MGGPLADERLDLGRGRAVGISYQTLLNWKLAGSGRRSGLYFDFFYAITAAENHALTLVEETHYQLITTGIERVREHVKEELDENGNVIKRVREITKETVNDRGGCSGIWSAGIPSAGPRCFRGIGQNLTWLAGVICYERRAGTVQCDPSQKKRHLAVLV